MWDQVIRQGGAVARVRLCYSHALKVGFLPLLPLSVSLTVSCSLGPRAILAFFLFRLFLFFSRIFYLFIFISLSTEFTQSKLKVSWVVWRRTRKLQNTDKKAPKKRREGERQWKWKWKCGMSRSMMLRFVIDADP